MTTSIDEHEEASVSDMVPGVQLLLRPPNSSLPGLRDMKSKDGPSNGGSDEFPGAAGRPPASDGMVPMDAEAWRRMAHFVADLRHARDCGNELPFENEAE